QVRPHQQTQVPVVPKAPRPGVEADRPVWSVWPCTQTMSSRRRPCCMSQHRSVGLQGTRSVGALYSWSLHSRLCGLNSPKDNCSCHHTVKNGPVNGARGSHQKKCV